MQDDDLAGGWICKNDIVVDLLALRLRQRSRSPDSHSRHGLCHLEQTRRMDNTGNLAPAESHKVLVQRMHEKIVA